MIEGMAEIVLTIDPDNGDAVTHGPYRMSVHTGELLILVLEECLRRERKQLLKLIEGQEENGDRRN